MQLKPGVVFNRNSVQKDLQRVFGLGIFQDLKVSLNPGQDPRKVIVVVNATEGKSFSLAPSGGFSSSNGFFAAGSFQAKNWAGRNQKLGTEVQWSQRGLLFDANFTDPWIAGDRFRTSYTVNGFRRQTISRIFGSRIAKWRRRAAACRQTSPQNTSHWRRYYFYPSSQ
jgi:outer membrane protein insertion porin family